MQVERVDETIAKAREAEIAKETKKQEVREVKRSERMMRVAYGSSQADVLLRGLLTFIRQTNRL